MKTFALLLVPNMTQLDFTGPYEVLVRSPKAKVELVWKTLDPVQTEYGLTITPTSTLSSLTHADVLFIPGGRGINAVLTDEEVVRWVRRVASEAEYVTSVCTGALLLGAAGLLRGRKATTHWTAMDMLSLFGAIPTKARTVFDGNLVTGGGVTAGVDFALRLVEKMHGPDIAQSIQLSMEYDPQPPFASGHPDTAPQEITKALLERIEPRQRERLDQVKRAVERLGP